MFRNVSYHLKAMYISYCLQEEREENREEKGMREKWGSEERHAHASEKSECYWIQGQMLLKLRVLI